jgi:hypothetical protein
LAQVINPTRILDEGRPTQHKHRGIFISLVRAIWKHEFGKVVHDKAVTKNKTKRRRRCSPLLDLRVREEVWGINGAQRGTRRDVEFGK